MVAWCRVWQALKPTNDAQARGPAVVGRLAPPPELARVLAGLALARLQEELP